MPRPGASAAPGQHWVYHVDGHRKCWFQADEATVSLRKRAHHYAARSSVAAPEEDEPTPRKKAVLDARAQLRNEAPADAFQPPATAAPDVVEPASVPANGGASVAPAAPVAVAPTIDRPTPDHATPRSVDVEALLAASALAEDRAASSAPAVTTSVPSAPDPDEGNLESTATRVGEVLIALGLIFLVGTLLARVATRTFLSGSPRVLRRNV